MPANEFLNLEGDKISTSRNWAVWLHEYLEDFPEKNDELRYVLTSIAPETKDSEFTWKDFQARINNELVAIFGNFVNRSVVLTHKYFEGKVPERGVLTELDKVTLSSIDSISISVITLIEQYKFRDALNEAMTLARTGNKYLADTEPWILIKTDPARVETIMNIALQITAALSEIFIPFLPTTSAKLKDMMNITDSISLQAGHQINKPHLLFQKIEDEAIEQQISKLNATKIKQSNPKATPMKDEITFDDFTKMDIRTGTILTAEKHPDADKLLKMSVDTGIDVRTIVSGIAEHYQPADIIGKQVAVLVNLAPRKIRGVESQGMILMAESNKNELAFVSPEKAIDNGGEIR